MDINDKYGVLKQNALFLESILISVSQLNLSKTCERFQDFWSPVGIEMPGVYDDSSSLVLRVQECKKTNTVSCASWASVSV